MMAISLDRISEAQEIRDEQLRSAALSEEEATAKFTDIAERRIMAEVRGKADYGFADKLTKRCMYELAALALRKHDPALLPPGYRNMRAIDDDSRIVDAIQAIKDEFKEQAMQEFIEAGRAPVPETPAYELEDL